jgi:pre-mRNA-splicing helicase BRR2
MQKKGYEEIHIPRQHASPTDDSELVPVSRLEPWVRPLLPSNVKHLNHVQSRIYQAAFYSPDNLLISAPTSSGKTICAMLCMLHEIGQHITPRHGSSSGGEGAEVDVDLNAFKVVYIAPMKSLVQEMTGNFANRFERLGLTVRELSGDAQASMGDGRSGRTSCGLWRRACLGDGVCCCVLLR